MTLLIMHSTRHAPTRLLRSQHCGIDAFAKGKGSKVGEAIYVGTALSQVKDGKVRNTRHCRGQQVLFDSVCFPRPTIQVNFGRMCVPVEGFFCTLHAVQRASWTWCEVLVHGTRHFLPCSDIVKTTRAPAMEQGAIPHASKVS